MEGVNKLVCKHALQAVVLYVLIFQGLTAYNNARKQGSRASRFGFLGPKHLTGIASVICHKMTSSSLGSDADILTRIGPLYQRFRRLATVRFGMYLVARVR